MRTLFAAAFGIAAALGGVMVSAQGGRRPAIVDLQGMWAHANLMQEDRPILINATGGGAQPGDYTGFPLNDAGRMWTDTWTGDRLGVPENQCMPHPSQYSLYGPGDWRITDVVDPVTQDITGFELYGTFEHATRMIWLDGRPHPPEWARHTWAGFSTGKWDGNMLDVSTTHLKEAWVHRNGITVDDESTMSEHFIKHDNYLTAIWIVNDPHHFEEPMIRSSSAVLDPTTSIGPAECSGFNVITMLSRPRGYVPHILPGENTALNTFARQHGLPPEATRGGSKTLYPEYQAEIRKMIEAQGIRIKPAATPSANQNQ